MTTGTGSPVTWAANEQNEITNAGAGTTTPVYDADGNMITDQNGATDTWDAWNRLVSVTVGTTVETFTYDAASRLVTDTVGGVTTNRFYSNQDQVLEEQSGGNWTARYVWSPVYVNALIFRDTPASGTRMWAEQDANYNVVALVNASGAVVERFDYSAFGVQTGRDTFYTLSSKSLILNTGIITWFCLAMLLLGLLGKKTSERFRCLASVEIIAPPQQPPAVPKPVERGKPPMIPLSPPDEPNRNPAEKKIEDLIPSVEPSPREKPSKEKKDPH